MAQVVPFKVRQIAAVPPATVTIPLTDLDQLPKLMLHLGVAVEMASAVLEKRASHGDDAVRDGIEQVFSAFNRFAAG